MDLTVSQIVWARRNNDDIYWPGKITIISNNTQQLCSVELHYNYLVQFFVTNQSIWVTDLLPYRQYRDSMTNDSFMNYGLHPTIRQDFLNAIHQADYACSNELYNNSQELTSMTMMTTQQQQPSPRLLPLIEDNTDNDFLLTPAPMLTSDTEYDNSSYQQSSSSTIQSLDTFSSNTNNKTTQAFTTNNDWYSQQGLIVESITPPLLSQNDDQPEYTSSSDNSQETNAIRIITTKTYYNSSFIVFLSNCFSHHSIIYIDDLTTTHYQHPTASSISYLICLDHFDSTIKHTLTSTILNNLNAHINYFFLVINSPSHHLVQHLYSTVMDQRTILILHYHSTFDNEPLLLCSGNRTTFEMIRLTLLKYLCSKVKYIESCNNEEEQLYSAYCISSIVQSTNVLHQFINDQIHETLNKKFDIDFQRKNENVINELFPQLSLSQNSHQNHLSEFIRHSNEDIFQNKSKQSTIMNDLFQNGAIKTHIPPPICEYYIQNILHEK